MPGLNKLGKAKRQRLALIMVMAAVVLIVSSISIFFLYQTAFDEQRERLIEVAQSNARLIETVARFDAKYSEHYPGGTEAATLSQIIEAHEKYKAHGLTAELSLGRRKGDHVELIFSHTSQEVKKTGPLVFGSPLAEAMQRALQGESGTLVGLDFLGVKTLAAYEPIAVLNLGLVAKISLEEVREPFYHAILVASGIGAMVIFAGIFVFVRLSNPMVEDLEQQARRLAEANSRLQTEVEVRKQAEQALMRLGHRLQDIREEEKTRIAREVHDKLGQSLTALKLDLACLQSEVSPENRPMQEVIRSMMILTDETINSVQKISCELRPQILDVFGLSEAIKWQVDEYRKRSSIHFDLSRVDSEIDVAPEISTTLFRIFQETLTNIVRHAGATKAWVRFYRAEGKLALEVEDNGVGVDPGVVHAPHSLGLMGIRERAHTFNGNVDIEGRPGKGTRVTIKIPVEVRA